MTVAIHPTGYDVGAEIKGVDISRPLDPGDLATLETPSSRTRSC